MTLIGFAEDRDENNYSYMIIIYGTKTAFASNAILYIKYGNHGIRIWFYRCLFKGLGDNLMSFPKPMKLDVNRS